MGLRPSKYGYKTVKQRKGSDANEDEKARAKRYGLKHGYSGMLGGWIYDKTGQHVCHGWGHFWDDRKNAIIIWEKSQDITSS